MAFTLTALFVALLHVSLAHCCVAVQRLPTVDLGYAIHQATLNVRTPRFRLFVAHNLTVEKSSGQHPYLNFSNIRFGQAPIGPLRFSPPLAPQDRNTTVNNGQQGTVCPQSNPGMMSTSYGRPKSNSAAVWLETAVPFLTAYLGGQNISNFTYPRASQNLTEKLNISSIPLPDPRTTEDCLFLDVIVPRTIFNSKNGRESRQHPFDSRYHSGKPQKEAASHGGAPVLVWIYGGGYTSGDKTSAGNPAGLVSRSLENGNEGVIFIAMNYRLGLFVSYVTHLSNQD